METWVPVVGYEEYYEVSDYGRVRNIAVGNILSGGVRGKYRGVVLYSGTKASGKSRYIHHLVTEAFLGKRRLGRGSADWQVNHKNGITQDNRAANLEYLTHRENHIHAAQAGLAAHGERNPASKLTAQQVREIMRLRGDGIKRRPIAEQFGVTVSAIQNIDEGGWRHLRQ